MARISWHKYIEISSLKNKFAPVVLHPDVSVPVHMLPVTLGSKSVLKKNDFGTELWFRVAAS